MDGSSLWSVGLGHVSQIVYFSSCAPTAFEWTFEGNEEVNLISVFQSLRLGNDDMTVEFES